jgi:AraC-like DNA-binding protein
MAPRETEHVVQSWTSQDTLLEWHWYPPGPAGELPAHVHDEYQFCLSLDTPGEYRLRRARHAVPVGSLSIIHPGEVHSARDPEDRHAPANYQVLYVTAERLAATVGQVNGGTPRLPTFRSPIILDAPLAARLLRYHSAFEAGSLRLDLDERLLSVLATIIVRHADLQVSSPALGQERSEVRSVREYLDSNYAKDVSLARLADLVNLSPYHLVRTFRDEIGVPPHTYQFSMRISRAKVLLLRGEPLARVATETGFADQSHFTRHFKRYVGTPPGHYVQNRNSNIVQDDWR